MSESIFHRLTSRAPTNVVQQLLAHYFAGFRHHSVPYGLGAAIFAIGFGIMKWAGGFQMTPSFGKFAGNYLIFAAACVLSLTFILKLVSLILFERPDRPLKHIAQWVVHGLADPRKLANGIHGSSIVFLVMGGFTMMKHQVAALGHFAWDPALMAFERGLHFNHLPQDLLANLFSFPLLVKFIDQAYVVWFPVLFGATLIASFQSARSVLRWRFMVSFALIWGFGGCLLANLFSSAGPVYFGLAHGAADPYASHMQGLKTLAGQVGIEALRLQQGLWDSYAAVPSFSSISAFPSMHVAITTLIFLACRHLRAWLKWLAATYLALIFTGSILLGWHYAIDGYAGGLIACVAWALSAAMARKFNIRESLQA